MEINDVYIASYIYSIRNNKPNIEPLGETFGSDVSWCGIGSIFLAVVYESLMLISIFGEIKRCLSIFSKLF